MATLKLRLVSFWRAPLQNQRLHVSLSRDYGVAGLREMLLPVDAPGADFVLLACTKATLCELVPFKLSDIFGPPDDMRLVCADLARVKAYASYPGLKEYVHMSSAS
eukprot:scaffold151573_cov39-Prasinocladus_malaysianus.AAC.1